MKFTTLDAWLDWQSTLNPAEIDLGLDRIGRVLQRMGHAQQFDCPLIMVGGTNGKGSVVAMLESIAMAAGYRVCSYTSPHIITYNERIKIDGEPVDDDSLCQAFERVDQCRGDVQLTYFEFGTLAAIDLFMRTRTDLVILEVGLGGRLDAVNIMQPDVSVITSIAIDHTDWLGDNRDDIAREKAGIARAHRPLICGDSSPPVSLLEVADKVAAQLIIQGRQYNVGPGNGCWNLQSPYGDVDELPLPALQGAFQMNNAATAIVAMQALVLRLPVSRQQFSEGLVETRLNGRFEILSSQPMVIADVAHNPQAVASLVDQLRARPVEGKTRFVIAMLADKPVDEVVELLLPLADHWYTAGLENQARGRSSSAMADAVRRGLAGQGRLDEAGMDVKLCAESTVEAAIDKALADSRPQDRIIILGSFHTVAAAMAFFS